MPQSNYTLQCIERAVDYMSDEMRNGRKPALEEISKAAGLSKYHFNRLYKLATGETPSETLTRFQLARAAERMRNPEVSITDVAFSAGYSSSQSFAKALNRVLSTSASSMRESSERLGVAIETLIVPQNSDGSERSDLSIEIAQIEPFKAIALRTDGIYPSMNASFWALFEAARDPEKVEAIIGHPFGDIKVGETHELRFDCALKLSKVPDQLPESIIQTDFGGGASLLTRHIGAYDQLPEAVDRLYLTTLSQNEVKIADAPMLFHYLDDPETTDESELRTDIYLSLHS